MNIFKTRDVKTPARGTLLSAGLDLFVPNDYNYKLMPNSSTSIPAGLKISIPTGYALIAFNKSGIAVKHNVIVGACVIDEDYVNEIHLHVINVGSDPVNIVAGQKLIQVLLVPVNYAEVNVTNSELECFGDRLVTTDRVGGFGSTGLT